MAHDRSRLPGGDGLGQALRDAVYFPKPGRFKSQNDDEKTPRPWIGATGDVQGQKQRTAGIGGAAHGLRTEGRQRFAGDVVSPFLDKMAGFGMLVGFGTAGDVFP